MTSVKSVLKVLCGHTEELCLWLYINHLTTKVKKGCTKVTKGTLSENHLFPVFSNVVIDSERVTSE